MAISPTGKQQRVLITGGSGLVGRYLTSLLLDEGYNVSHLSRKQSSAGRVKVYRWDLANRIPANIFPSDFDYIIHLAGESIWGKRWSGRQKQLIIKSRVDSARFLYESFSSGNTNLKAFISASAIGYYGSLTSEKTFTESDPPADDFTGSVCRKWEDTADLFSQSGIRTVKIRTGVVLEKNSGALGMLMIPARYGIFSYPGKGNHNLSWIHIQDLCSIYLEAIRNDNLQGPYNAVSPHQVTYKEFLKTLAAVMGKPFFHPPLPAFLLKLYFGEMSAMILAGSKVDPGKIIKTGFNFAFENLYDALNDIQN
jgi:hypothetical protein